MDVKLLKDRAGIITGGASGIGRAAAVLFASEGTKVLVADFTTRQAEKRPSSSSARLAERPIFAIATCVMRNR